MKILHLIPDLGCTGTAKQLTTLVLGLPREGFDVHVGLLTERKGGGRVSIGSNGTHGIRVHTLGTSQRFDPVCCWRLGRLIRELRPDIIHAWGPLAAGCALSAKLRSPAHVVIGKALAPFREPGFVQRWSLRRAARVIACGSAEADRYTRAGVSPSRISIVPPAVPDRLNSAGNGRSSGFTRFVLCAGTLERCKGFRNAIWALDILKFLFPDLKLLLAGDGPDRPELERFASRVQLNSYVRFLGTRADLPDLLDKAQIVWVPSDADCGLHMTLEAMAAGKPVIASDVPILREVIDDGRTGFLVPAGDIPLLARRSRELLRDPELASGIGAEAHSYAAQFSTARFIERMASVYRGVIDSER